MSTPETLYTTEHERAPDPDGLPGHAPFVRGVRTGAGVGAALIEFGTAPASWIDSAPRTGIAGSRVAFVHPQSTGGVLTELVQRRTR